MKANIIILASLIGALLSPLYATELDQKARFEAFYSVDAPVEENLPADEEATPAPEEGEDEAQTPEEGEQPEEGETQDPVEEDEGQDMGKAWEELDPSDFMQEIYSFSSMEKYRAAKQYISNRRVQRKSFINLIQGMKTAGLRNLHVNPLVGLYISLRKTELDTVEFLELLKEFTPETYQAKTKQHNWPLQSAIHYIQISDPSRLEIWGLSKLFKLAGMNYRFVDEDLMQAFVQAHGQSLSPTQMKRILSSLNHDDYDVVQREAVLVQMFMHKNIKRLTQEDFREDFEEIKQSAPFDLRVNRVSNMPTDARKNLYYVEYKYFQSIWTRDLFFTMGKVISLFEENVPSRDHVRLVKTFIERNAHRLSDKDIKRLQDQFLGGQEV